MKIKVLIAFGLAVILAVAIFAIGNAVSGAAFTTFNPWVDGLFKDVCKNSLINCNIYGVKPDVWLNGGPEANGLSPNGDYFFAVLVPGGQPNPNDGGAKNLSDDYDAYTNRIFTIKDGEVSIYGGTHDQDSGNFLDPSRNYCTKPRGCVPDGKPPLIRLYPYADTTNPGGVYILAVCSLEDGYPVDPRDCKYDAFKVKQGPSTASLLLWGMKFEDEYANGKYDPPDHGLVEWSIHIFGTGFTGEPIDVIVKTDANGFWSFQKDYSYTKTTTLVPAELTICEVIPTPPPYWTQSFPESGCYQKSIEPSSLAEAANLDFGNWLPVDVTVCKVRDMDGELGGVTIPLPGWTVSLTKDGVVIDTQLTGADGCYTWQGLNPASRMTCTKGPRLAGKPW